MAQSPNSKFLTRGNYDLVASLYDSDMGLNMPYDDIGFYRERAQGSGSVLEIGAGTGRIGLHVAEACDHFVGIDASLPMLKRFDDKLTVRQRAGARIHLIVMDANAMALSGTFDFVYFGFSGINYIARPEDVIRLLAALKAILGQGGRILLDAFVPNDIAGIAGDWTVDYVRPLENGARFKRCRKILKEGFAHRIFRRYEIFSENEGQADVFVTESLIRPYRPDELRAFLVASGYVVVGEWFNYGDAGGDAPAFFSIEGLVA